jgi:hypothetical protein
VALTALAIMAAGAWLKVIRTVVRDRAVRGVAILQVLVVACVYDLGRALALVTPAGHRRLNSPTVPAAS